MPRHGRRIAQVLLPEIAFDSVCRAVSFAWREPGHFRRHFELVKLLICILLDQDLLIVVVVGILLEQFVVDDVDLVVTSLKLFGFQNSVVLVELVTYTHHFFQSCSIVSSRTPAIRSFSLALADSLGPFQIDLAKNWLDSVLLLSIEHLFLRTHALK